MPVQYQKPDDRQIIAQAVEVWAEDQEISPYPDNDPPIFNTGGGPRPITPR